MNMVLSTAHSTAFHIKDIPCQILPQISEHNLKLPTYHTDPALLSFCIPDRLYLPCTIATTLHASTHYIYILHAPAIPFQLPSTTLLCTQLTQSIVGKIAQDVGMMQMCCGVVSILFVWFMRIPSLHVHAFIQKTF